MNLAIQSSKKSKQTVGCSSTCLYGGSQRGLDANKLAKLKIVVVAFSTAKGIL